jgi:anti-sigma factor RsiW
MKCNQAHELLDAYHDGELSPSEQRDLKMHLDTCKSCNTILVDYDRIGKSIKAEGRTPMPPGLTARVSAALNRVEVDELNFSERPAGWLSSKMNSQVMRSFVQRAAALAAVCLISVFATWSVMKSSSHTDQIERDILNAHIRSLLLDSPVQVASSDQHAVRPWFAGRIDFSPAIKDLAAEGFPLLGGRLDYVNDRRVGAVVYQHQKHIINVFMWASTEPGVALHSEVRNGYNVLYWSRNGIEYWAISDLNSDEMIQLQLLM